MTHMSFGLMTRDDLDEVTDIELHSYPFPWTHDVFADSLTAGYRAWTARDKGKVIAYALMMVVLDEVHLLNITVMPELQGQGLGKKLLQHLFSDARAQGTKYMFLEVRPSNKNAIEMYSNFGFLTIGERRGYYPAAHGPQVALTVNVAVEV